MYFFWHLLAIISISIPHTLSFNLILGRGKILYFGPIALSIVAAYALIITVMATGSYTLGLSVSVFFTVLVAAIMAMLAMRLEPDGFGILSIAMQLALLAVVLNGGDFTRGALGFAGVPRVAGIDSLPLFALLSAAIAIIWIIGMTMVDRSRLGRELTALAENEWHAQALGIDRARVYMIAFFIEALGAVSTSFLAPQYIRLLHPSDYSFAWLVTSVMFVVAGKPGSVKGVAVATALLILLKEGLRFVDMPAGVLGPLRLLLFGGILLIAVAVRRKDLFPLQRTV